MKKKIGLFVLLSSLTGMSYGQGQAGAKLGPIYQAYVDSIKARPYPYHLPVYGKRLAKKGFDLPLAGGIMINPFIASQKMTISDLQVGVNNSELVPMDFVKFGEVKASLQSLTVRPDVWIFPFLDVYGIGGVTWTHTSISVDAPVNINTTADFFGTTFGLGATLAGGYHGFIGIFDFNHTWTSIAEIEGPIQATMFTPRIGYSWRFPRKPQQNITVWVGAPGIFIGRTTVGSINMADIAPEGSREAIQRVVDETEAWYQDLGPAQKVVVKSIAEKIVNKLDGLTSELEINYSLMKRPVSHWSMCVGGQFQLNHRWQFRTEAGFFGGRRSLLLSGNYRFGI